MKKESMTDVEKIKLETYLKPKDFRLVEQRYIEIPHGVGEIMIIIELSKKSQREYGFDIPLQYGYVRITDFAKDTLGFTPKEVSLHDWQDGSWLLVIRNMTDEKMFFAADSDVQSFIKNARRNQLVG
jgi:hypothetical protein